MDRVLGPRIGKGNYGVMANRSETGIGTLRAVIAPHSAPE